MSKLRLKLPEVYPTSRLAAAFAAGSLWFFAMPWGGGLFMWLGIGYNLSLVVLAAFDYVRLLDSHECTVSRDRQSTLSVGVQNPVWIEVAHRGRRPLKVTVKDEPPLEFEVSPRTLTFDVGPNESERRNYKGRPGERGDYFFGDVNARFTTPLGLLMRQERVPAETPVKVYPDVFQTKKHRLLARENRVVQMGLRRSKMHGQGQEFERLRDYLPDDSLRHIDWKATARRGILTTREYDLERSQSIMLLLDIGRNMASRTVESDGTLGISKADCAINASVLLAHVAAQSDDRIGLFCFAREPVVYIPPGKGLPQAARLLEALYPLQPRLEESSYYESFMLVSQKQRKRSLVFLFTDLIDAEASSRLISCIGLLARKHLVVCAALADYELPSIIGSRPAKASELYTQAVALTMVRERREALAQLARQGVIALDAAPSDLSVATVNKYLQLKREARL
ncbi:MAG TPA: DUF58 domain-containing protein [Armatimonadota bacterium]|nr:DUF58 domain-containing protein [Armatimonadota bacterium]